MHGIVYARCVDVLVNEPVLWILVPGWLKQPTSRGERVKHNPSEQSRIRKLEFSMHRCSVLMGECRSTKIALMPFNQNRAHQQVRLRHVLQMCCIAGTTVDSRIQTK